MTAAVPNAASGKTLIAARSTSRGAGSSRAPNGKVTGPTSRRRGPACRPRTDPAFVRTPIDRFVLAKLKEHDLKPSPEADRRTLIRRLSFDLIGLPPTPAEVEAFVHDEVPDAYEKLVDGCSASPHYGERMAVCWLDLVRFADTVGYHGDQTSDDLPRTATTSSTRSTRTSRSTSSRSSNSPATCCPSRRSSSCRHRLQPPAT